jgi:hypothetical protein
VQVSACDASGALLASGGSDRSVMVHDVDGAFATHSFRGAHEGLVTALAFQPHPVSVQRLVSGGSDGSVCVWDLLTQQEVLPYGEGVDPRDADAVKAAVLAGQRPPLAPCPPQPPALAPGARPSPPTSCAPARSTCTRRPPRRTWR